MRITKELSKDTDPYVPGDRVGKDPSMVRQYSVVAMRLPHYIAP